MQVRDRYGIHHGVKVRPGDTVDILTLSNSRASAPFTPVRSSGSTTPEGDPPVDVEIPHTSSGSRPLRARKGAIHVLLTLRLILEIAGTCDKSGLNLSITAILLRVRIRTASENEWLIVLVHRHARRLCDIIRNGITGVLIGNQGLVTTEGLGSTPCVERSGNVLYGGAVNLDPLVMRRHLSYYIGVVTGEREGESGRCGDDFRSVGASNYMEIATTST